MRRRGTNLIEYGIVVLVVRVVAIGALRVLGIRTEALYGLWFSDVAASAPAEASNEPAPSATPAPVLLARWVFDETCNGWWNADWSGSGCEADGSPKRMESPLIETEGGSTVNVVVEGNEGSGPTNLVIKLAEYDGDAFLGTTNLGTLASSNPTLDSDTDLTTSTDRIRLTATGPGELRVVELWLLPAS